MSVYLDLSPDLAVLLGKVFYLLFVLVIFNLVTKVIYE